MTGDGVRDYATGFAGSDGETSPVYVIVGAARGVPSSSSLEQRAAFRIDVPRLVPSLGRPGGCDGLDEIALATSDQVIVVFGTSEAGSVDVNELGASGFTIDNVAWRSSSSGDGISVNEGIVAVGDQNGDGRDDLAVADGDDVKIVYTPDDPAGARVDADALEDGGAVVSPGPRTRSDPALDVTMT